MYNFFFKKTIYYGLNTQQNNFYIIYNIRIGGEKYVRNLSKSSSKLCSKRDITWYVWYIGKRKKKEKEVNRMLGYLLGQVVGQVVGGLLNDAFDI